MSRAERTVDESNALRVIEGLLKDLYGDYSITQEIKDSPDAGIISASGNAVGIEFTNIDSEKFLAYKNSTLKKIDKTSEKKGKSGLLGETETARIYIVPKRISSILLEDKNTKYSKYKSNYNGFEDVILVIHSNFLVLNSKSGFPINEFFFALQEEFRESDLQFDYVIFANLPSEEATLIFSKQYCLLKKPRNYDGRMWQGNNVYIERIEGLVKLTKGMIQIDASQKEAKRHF